MNAPSASSAAANSSLSFVGVAGGGLMPVTNGGGATSYGLEALIRHDLAGAQGGGFALPAYAGVTWTRARFGDIELYLELLLPAKGNSGVYLHGLYEIQLLDSHGSRSVHSYVFRRRRL